MKRIVILGGGTGGTLTANRLRRSYDEQDAEIVVVDHDADHVDSLDCCSSRSGSPR